MIEFVARQILRSQPFQECDGRQNIAVCAYSDVVPSEAPAEQSCCGRGCEAPAIAFRITLIAADLADSRKRSEKRSAWLEHAVKIGNGGAEIEDIVHGLGEND